MKRLLGAMALCLAVPAWADEGMWTYDNFPSKAVGEKYGFEPTQEWLDHLRLSSLRIARGCSASFVSPQGLVLTNHHCVISCVEELSTASEDLVNDGFYARTLQEERTCPNFELNQLRKITDVTARIRKATEGKEGKAYGEALGAELSRIEKECATSDDLRCDVVPLYNGGQYHLYEYKRYRDVRLVFAPEVSVGFFGGDPDNFQFPRYNLDAAFLRAWENGAPAETEHFLTWSSEGARAGELTFVSGHPGSTSRQQTVAQLEAERDHRLPERLFYLSEYRGMLTEFQKRGPEQRRIAATQLFFVENSFKALKGRWQALVSPALLEQKRAEEAKLRAWVEADPSRRAKYGDAWDAIAKTQRGTWRLMDEHAMIEGNRRGASGFQSDLFSHARILVRGAEEREKPTEQRLREFGDASLPAIEQRIASRAPIYPELEIARLSFSLTKLRETLGPDHPFVKETLGSDSPESLARKLVEGSRLGDPEVRMQLWRGGKNAIDASDDPMIAFAKRIDPAARRVRAAYEAQIDSVVRANASAIARARFEAYGTSTYPDATFTLRLSYGQVKGWMEDGQPVEPITAMGGLFERATGAEPYALPERWLKAKSRLDLDTPMNFVTDNDIIGGNSGSPTVNEKGELTGLIFDGNIHSLGGEFGFDPVTNRAVAVHARAIVESLRKVYGADRILDELVFSGEEKKETARR